MGEKRLFLNAKRVIIASIIISLIIATAEIIIASITDSLALLADGFDAVGNALISVIVLIGLLMVNKRPDEIFNFGYYKVETLSSFVAAFLSILLAGYVIYFSISSIFDKHVIHDANIALLTVVISLIPSITISLYKIRIAKQLGYLSVRTDAINSLKDSLGSVTAIVGLFLSTIGYIIFDAVAAIIIAILISLLSFFVLRESTYILLDACNNPELRTVIVDLSRGIEYIKKVANIRMRKIGSLIHTEVEIEVDDNIPVKKMKEAIREYEQRIKKVIGRTTVSIIVKP